MRPAVSIPFIAGQWSLHAGGDLAEVRRRVSIPFIAGQWSLRGPRKDGHSVKRASQSPSLRGSGRFADDSARDQIRRKVSIPFIAGQWSLLLAAAAVRQVSAGVSIPFIAGQWSLLGGPGRPPRQKKCLNPLHCGAVVASTFFRRGSNATCLSQSPSLRGSGRFRERMSAW